MTNGQYATASKIFHAISSQDFADFYGYTPDVEDENAPFTLFLQGDSEAPSRDEILEKIVRLFRILENGDFR